ncbi:MAG: phosphoribosylanthranilate isomerase [Lachnospiraceae bacterium]|nr:phosphoribosylanthranilate isomerase [Lachnospiraceae bacterium]
MVRIKICGLMRMEDVEAVNLYRPDYIGFIFAPSRRRITVETAENMAGRLDDGIQRVGVFVDENREKIAKITESGIINVVQLHGHESDEDVTWISERTGVPVIKSVSVRTSDDIEGYRHNPADYLLLDNGAGGSGEKFDWTHVHDIERDFFIAGGINISNIEEALKFNPYCVDVSSGVETDGYKDPDKIHKIIDIVRRK